MHEDLETQTQAGGYQKYLQKYSKFSLFYDSDQKLNDVAYEFSIVL